MPERLQTSESTISALFESVVRRQAVGLADLHYRVPVGDAWSCGNDRRLRDGHRQLDVSFQASCGLTRHAVRASPPWITLHSEVALRVSSRRVLEAAYARRKRRMPLLLRWDSRRVSSAASRRRHWKTCLNVWTFLFPNVPLLTQALDLLGEISWDELRAPSG